jgi:oxygen-independent coproporphyrinogen-3 oxidase
LTFDSLYFGGGTPSILSEEGLSHLIKSIRCAFNISPSAEMTIEVNPEDLNREKAFLIKNLGFNRLSIGIQSLNDKELLFLGRRHSAGEAIGALEAARNSGFTSISIDLMYGFQGQSKESWLKKLNRIISFAPEHISCYQFTIKNHTPFEALLKEGKITPIDESTESDFFMLTSSYLEDKGYLHYEVSNFAKGYEFIARHNTKYWNHAPYLGLGPSAHSFIDGVRWRNVRSIMEYINMLDQGKPPIESAETLTKEQLFMEKLLLGFRTRSGVELNLLREQLNGNAVINRLLESDIAEIRDNRLAPTLKGYLVADSLPLLFIEA